LKNIDENLIVLNTFDDLKHQFKWNLEPIIEDPIFFQIENELDENNRRLLDAQVIGLIMRNLNPQTAVEIGTAEGHTTALMSKNSPNTHIFTLNIPPEELQAGDGGKLTTAIFEREKIGSYYREIGCKNITQIFSDSAKWKPDIGSIDFVFIDGCHDKEYVYNDTVKVMSQMKKPGIIIWHDFNIDLINRYEWIYSVGSGVELLYKNKLIDGPIYHLKNSWMGFYFVK
jgi:predicted O-methyltransferase YrrM